MANNIEWLKEHFLIVGSVARIDSKKVTISNDEYQHLELAITAKINEIEQNAFKKGQRVGQYQAADKIYGIVPTLWLFKDSNDPATTKMNLDRTDDLLKETEKLLNHNRKAYTEYLAELRKRKDGVL